MCTTESWVLEFLREKNLWTEPQTTKTTEKKEINAPTVHKDESTTQEIAEKMAAIDIRATEYSVLQFQFDYLCSNKYWFSLGSRDGIEYGVYNRYLGSFFDIIQDQDHEKLVPTPTEPGKIEEHRLASTYSLHRIIEAPSPPCSTNPTQQPGPRLGPERSQQSNSRYQDQAPAQEQSLSEAAVPSESSSTQPEGANETVPQCEKVLSRFFQVGRVFAKRGDIAEHKRADLTNFIAVWALGPPECRGFWITATTTRDEWVDKYDSDRGAGLDETMTDSEIAQMRRDRVYFLDGFPEQMSYARIKEDKERKVFELEETSASRFVISKKRWFTK